MNIITLSLKKVVKNGLGHKFHLQIKGIKRNSHDENVFFLSSPHPTQKVNLAAAIVTLAAAIVTLAAAIVVLVH